MDNQNVKIINLTDEQKKVILDAIGYGTDEEGYVVEFKSVDGVENKRVLDRYTGEPVKLKNASILPGSTIIIDTNSFSLAEYFEEFGGEHGIR